MSANAVASFRPDPAFPDDSPLRALPAGHLAALVGARDLSSVELVSHYLDRIEAVNPSVNAVVSLRPRGEILAEAEGIDRAIAGGAAPGPLCGLPVAIKDLALTRGLRTTFGSPLFADFVPEEDDYFVARMRAAGAIVVGKTNTPEWGFGSQTYNPVFGTTRNAFDPGLAAGGSSGGAAVAVALRMLPLADGSDMGGSLRNPAAYASIFGMRPSQGLVPGGPSNELFLSQMGVEGPMARNVSDLRLLLAVQAGHHPGAPLSHDGDVGRHDAGRPHVAKHILWLSNMGGHLAMEEGVLDICRAALSRFETAGWTVDAGVPALDPEALWRAFVTLRQATSGLALKCHYDAPEQRAKLKPEAVWEVENGLKLSALDVYRASSLRSDWYREAMRLFETWDFLALPSAQVFAFDADMPWPSRIGDRTMDSYHRWMEVSVYATMAGLPAVNLPAGFDGQGRAMGIQLIGRPRGDAALLDAAAAYEAMLPWPTGAAT